MMDCVRVYDVETSDKCSQQRSRVAIALSGSEEKTARRLGADAEQMIVRACAQAGLAVLGIGKSESLTVSLRAGRSDAVVRDDDEVRCPLCLHPLGGPPLLCTLHSCDYYSTACYEILSAAEAVLAEERPP